MKVAPIPPTVEWRRGRVRLIDQRALPGRLTFVECSTVSEVVRAVRDLVVRGAHGAALVPEGGRVLEQGKHPSVWVGETRPVLQGARLTAWELDRSGIEHALVADVDGRPRDVDGRCHSGGGARPA